MPRPVPDLTRRAFVARAATGAGALALASSPAAQAARRRVRDPLVTEGGCGLGVSSGFPGQREITLWTRVDGIERSSRIRLEVARDAQFRNVVAAEDVRVPALRDFTVHHRLRGGRLRPGEQYF